MSDQLAAAVALLAFAWLMGCYMSLAFRLFTAFGGKDKAKAVLDSKSFKVSHVVQLNNAEWAPFFIVCLLYLHVAKAGSRYSAALSVFSCVWFVMLKAFIFPGKPAAITATVRYLALGWLILEVAQTGY